jgi:NitT/TauT family transport system permease protein
MLPALWVTTKEVIYSFALATLIGFSLGVLVGETGFGEKAVMPYLVAIDTMPKIAFAPLFIAWLGFDISSKVALATFIATFPIVVGTAAGLHAADENARMLFKTMGASRIFSPASRSPRSASWRAPSRASSSAAARDLGN